MGFSIPTFVEDKYRKRLEAEYPGHLALSDVGRRFQKMLKRNGVVEYELWYFFV